MARKINYISYFGGKNKQSQFVWEQITPDMKKDLIRLDELWKLEKPTKIEIDELFNLCSKYPNIDSFDIVKYQ